MMKRLSCPFSPFLIRKHRAPKGALRLWQPSLTAYSCPDQKAPSAKRCIKTRRRRGPPVYRLRIRKHRAPKGALRPMSSTLIFVRSAIRKHRAPKGALRLINGDVRLPQICSIRKHRAPKGALRLVVVDQHNAAFFNQKAPSAKRCIKTPDPPER